MRNFLVETRGFEPLTPFVQTRISADSRQNTKRTQDAQLHIPPAFSFRRSPSAALRPVTVGSLCLRWLRYEEGTGYSRGSAQGHALFPKRRLKFFNGRWSRTHRKNPLRAPSPRPWSPTPRSGQVLALCPQVGILRLLQAGRLMLLRPTCAGRRQVASTK